MGWRIPQQVGQIPSNLHIADFFRAGEREGTSIWKRKHEMALLVQI